MEYTVSIRKNKDTDHMAQFKKGDYVQVTPISNPFPQWGQWDDNVQGPFCGRIGYIEDIFEDDKDTAHRPDGKRNPDEDLVQVAVFFSNPTFGKGDKWYHANFKKRHLILSSKANIKQYIFDQRAADETNKFEQLVRKKRDEIFRQIFADPNRTNNKKKKNPTKTSEWDSEWDEDTEEIQWSGVI